MTSNVIKFKGTELTVNTTSNSLVATVNNASLVRMIAAANTLVTVSNVSVNSSGGNVTTNTAMTILGGVDYFIQKYPADLIAVAANVQCTSVAFRE
jgi:hypothetical protein